MNSIFKLYLSYLKTVLVVMTGTAFFLYLYAGIKTTRLLENFNSIIIFFIISCVFLVTICVNIFIKHSSNLKVLFTSKKLILTLSRNYGLDYKLAICLILFHMFISSFFVLSFGTSYTFTPLLLIIVGLVTYKIQVNFGEIKKLAIKKAWLVTLAFLIPLIGFLILIPMIILGIKTNLNSKIKSIN